MSAITRAGASFLCLSVAGACATGARPPRSDRGTVTVGVTTTGTGAEAMMFRVTIEPAGIQAGVKADAGVLTRGDIAPGDHVVRLAVPAPCRVEQGAERRIVMTERGSVVVRFTVRC